MNQRPHISQSKNFQWPTAKDRERYLSVDDLKIYWGNSREQYNYRDMERTHFYLSGMQQSGKTTLLKLFMKSLLVNETSPSRKWFPLRYRTLLNDPKREFYPALRAWGIPESHIIISNPFDKRASAWDIAADIDSPALIEQFVSDICDLYERDDQTRQARQESPFWRGLATTSIMGIILGLKELAGKDGSWDLRDVILAAESNHDILYQILKLSHSGRKAWAKYYDSDTRDLPGNTDASVTNVLSRFEIPAALWSRAKTKFSISKWIEKGSLLLLGYDHKAKTVTRPANYLMLKFAISCLMDIPQDPESLLKSQQDLTWFLLDELSSIGKSPQLSELLDMGTGLGARVLVTSLGFKNLRRAFASDEEAAAITGGTLNKILLKMGHPDDIAEAQKFFGKAWKNITTRTVNHGQNQSVSISTAEQERFLVDYEDLDSLHLADKRGIDAYVLTGLHDARRARAETNHKMTKEQILSRLGPHLPNEQRAQAFVRRDDAEQELLPWTQDDYERFGLTMPEDGIPKPHSTPERPTAAQDRNNEDDIPGLRFP